MAIWLLGFVLAFATPVAAMPASAAALDGVASHSRVTFPRAQAAQLAATQKYGDLALVLDIDAPQRVLEARVDELPPEFQSRIETLEGGSRLILWSPGRRLRAALARGSSSSTLQLGVESEDTRLRRLANIVARPLPRPPELGAALELWEDAERATADASLPTARRLWEKLQEDPALADLAGVRIAELYLMSGHINEATARLRAVSRRFPRTTGAALARLDLLHAEAIIEGKELSAEQVDVAASSIDRRTFEAHAWHRAALILDEMGAFGAAADRLPPVDQLPQAWRKEAEEERRAVALRALAAPLLQGDFAAVVRIYEKHREALAAHPDRDEVLEVVSQAYLELGQYETAALLLRERLRLIPPRADEAKIVDQLAQAYGFLEDRHRAAEVLGFQLVSHPTEPHVLERIRAHVLQEQRLSGLDRAREQLAEWRKRTPVATQRSLLELEADLVSAFGTPRVQAQVLTALRDIGFADAAAHEPHLALALARSGRSSAAIPLLRRWIGKTQDPEFRDELTYALAEAELATGQSNDAVQLFTRIAQNGTRWGQVARLWLRARSLRRIVDEATSQPPGRESATRQ